MATYGYMRVSTKEQNEDRQLKALLEFGLDRNSIFCDKQSGKDFTRTEYQRMIEIMDYEDLLVIKSIDRLGRNYQEILEQWKLITQTLQAQIVIIDMPLLDTRKSRDLTVTLISDIVLQLLSFVAENERVNILERQAEGIKAAKVRGVKFGRPTTELPSNTPYVYERWKSGAIDHKTAREELGCSKAHFYRIVRKYESGWKVKKDPRA